MYDLINQNSAAILQQIGLNHVPDYDHLVANAQQQAAQPGFQQQYRQFWVMNQAQLCPNFYAAYFLHLQGQFLNPVHVGVLTNLLYQVPTHLDGRQSLHFSFTSKLAHMGNTHLPIYDSLVAAFYFFQPPNQQQPLEQRIASLVAFHDFLVREYRRVLAHGLLAPAIRHFRIEFDPQHFTDEKVIDSLIWGYVSLLRNGGIINGHVQYH